jgi:hypothetical protein
MGPVDCSREVIRWSVKHIDSHIVRANIRDVVPGTRGYQESPTVADLLVEGEIVLGRAHLTPATTLFDANELVVVGMDLKPDVVAGSNAHDGDLQVSARPQGRAIRVVSECRLLDVDGVGRFTFGHSKTPLRLAE